MKWKKIAGILFVAILLVFAFWYGGNGIDNRGFSIETTENTGISDNVPESNTSNTAGVQSGQKSQNTVSGQSADKKEKKGNIFQQLFMKISHKGSSGTSQNGQNSRKAQKNAQRAVKKASKDKKNTKQTSKSNHNQNAATSGGRDSATAANASTQTDSSKEDQTQQATTEKPTTEKTTENTADMISCTISISCSTLLNNMDKLAEKKHSLVPQDGYLLAATTVKVKKGGTVFDVLQKVTKDNNIQLEFNYTPAYKNYYIEGIGNLYEFDGGELSGWMYCVNGTFPEVGCSSYKVKDGDEIRWVYTCNLGKDVGGYFKE